MTTVEGVALYAQKTPDKAAAIARDITLTYSELWKETLGFTAYLKSFNLEKGSRVIVKAESDLWFLVTVLSINLSGCVNIPLENTIAKDGLESIARELNPSIVISDVNPEGDFIKIDSTKVRELAAEYYKEGLSFEFPTPDMLGDMLFTTGTTGKSKGVMIAHGMIHAVAENVIDGTELTDKDIFLIPSPINHAAGIRKFYATMRTGGTIVLLDGYKDIKKFYRYIKDYKATGVYIPPTAIRMLLLVSAKELAKYADQIRFIYTSAAPFPEVDKEKLISTLPNSSVYFAYGSSESGTACMLDCAKYRNKISCVGRQLKNTNLLIVDDDRKPIESSSENQGLIAIKSPANMVGYFNEPELTKEVLSDGIVYTNDIGYIDEDGLVYMLGRRGDVINCGGLKIAPTEVENVALRFPGVSECACFGVEDRMGSVSPRLNVVRREGMELDLNELRNFMGGLLEAYKVPKDMVIVDEIPKTANGKINRKMLK